MSDETVAYIGQFDFPDKNAAGKRVFTNCLLLRSIGYRVVCIGPRNIESNPCVSIEYHSIAVSSGLKRVLFNSLGLTKIFSILSAEQNLSYVILYGAIFTQRENRRIVEWCRIRKIKVLYDHVDWFEPDWKKPLRALMRINNNRILLKKIIPICDGVICVSSYLSNYHRENKKKTVTIPPLTDFMNKNINNSYHKVIRFVYAGTTSDRRRAPSQWKDRLDIMFQGLARVQNIDSTREFVLDVYGMTEEQYIMMFPVLQRAHGRAVLKTLGCKVQFHGIVDNDDTIRAVSESNFSLLIRDITRSTMAGFPTKVSESIACGTPVICTETSDLTVFIKNGYNGFICSGENYISTLINVLSMPDEQLFVMKQNCSENPFYYLNYKDKLRSFLGEVNDDI